MTSGDQRPKPSWELPPEPELLEAAQAVWWKVSSVLALAALITVAAAVYMALLAYRVAGWAGLALAIGVIGAGLVLGARRLLEY